MGAKRLYLVCYDIRGEGFERRLRKVYKTLRGYGEHVQFSVFRCALSDMQLACLEDDLEGVIDHRQDQVLLFDLGPAESRRSWQLTVLGVALDAPERVVRIV